MEQLLIEHWGQPGDCLKITESSTTAEKPGLYIEGVFLQADVVNRNKRLYPKAVLETAVNKYIKEQVKTSQALGELNHPTRAMVDPMQAAIIIEDMWWEGNNVMGRARVVEGDMGQGDKLAALIRSGWVPGVSSRGLGSVKSSGRGYNIVQDGFRLTVGVDVVWGPSAPDAFVTAHQVNENMEEIPLATVAPQGKNDAAFSQLIKSLKTL